MFVVPCSRSRILAPGVLLYLFACAGYADSLVLMSQTGGQYDYGIQINANHGIVFLPGNQIVLTGLFGVASASVLPDLAFAFTTVFSTDTSATMVDTTPIVLDPVSFTHTIAALRVTSSDETAGPVDYEIQTGNGTILSGVVAGPVASVPEPRTLALCVGGFIALVAIKRRCS